ncbi:MAG: DUF3040 domain-containing protein [Geodermatophilaceae bacterium]|nr:DUF3040 domain-containing protein [Geodermatophilaceae bacterium]
MPLSEHEQKLLEQIERELINDDPKFASTVRSADGRVRARRKLLWAVLFGILGFGMLIGGAVTSSIWFGVLGFCVMFGAAAIAVLNAGAAASKAPPGSSSPPSGKQGQRGNPVKSKLEERFRRRYDT